MTIQFKKILVANRGEIASRIFRGCKNLGVECIAVYSTADRGARWIEDADYAIELVGTNSAETYLNQSLIIDICKREGVDALHPGYGFLSENSEFAQACTDAGIKFIGPSPEAMRVMGSKAISREIAEKTGVPVTPASMALQWTRSNCFPKQN